MSDNRQFTVPGGSSGEEMDNGLDSASRGLDKRRLKPSMWYGAILLVGLVMITALVGPNLGAEQSKAAETIPPRGVIINATDTAMPSPEASEMAGLSGTNTSVPAPTQTHTLPPTWTPTPRPGDQAADCTTEPRVVAEQAMRVKPAGLPAGWREYHSAAGRFTIGVPRGWVATEYEMRCRTGYQGTHRLSLEPVGTQGKGLQLDIAFRHWYQDVQMTPTRVGTGAFVRRGTVRLDRYLRPRSLLVYEGKDKYVVYAMESPFASGHTYLTILLNDWSETLFEAVEISTQDQALADRVVESIRLDYQQPPPGWTLDEMNVGTKIYQSFDGQWTGEVLRGELSENSKSFDENTGYRDYNRITVTRSDGLRWVFEEWSGDGVGETGPTDLRWTADGRYLYFYWEGYAGGCGYRLSQMLTRMNLSNGEVEVLPVPEMGWGNFTLGPDASRLAYFGTIAGQEERGQGLILVSLPERKILLLPVQTQPDIENWGGGEPLWSPDGRRVAVQVYAPFPNCGEPLTIRYVALFDLEQGSSRRLNLPEGAWLNGWYSPDRLRLWQNEEQVLFEIGE